MFKWLGRLTTWRRKELDGPLVTEFGRYEYKPVMARVLSVVMDICQEEVVAIIANPHIEIFLNDEVIQGSSWARKRLESGAYEIKIPSQDKVWRFFIA